MTTTDTDFLAVLFPESTRQTGAEIAASLQFAQANEAARCESVRRALESSKGEKIAPELRCPRCAGEGRLSQFMHRKGGECFLCGGSGVFSGYTQ